MDISEKYFHWIWGENTLRDDNPEYLINLEIGISIQFDSELGMFATYEEFFNGIADIQFFYGNRPEQNKLDSILTDAWNYLALEERNLKGDLSNIDDEFP